MLARKNKRVQVIVIHGNLHILNWIDGELDQMEIENITTERGLVRRKVSMNR